MQVHSPSLGADIAPPVLGKIRKVCVLGGAGFVGQHITHRLHEAGYATRVLTRSFEHAKALTILPTVEVVEADVHDPATLERAFEGVDAVINLVGILHERKEGREDLPPARRGDFHAVHIELPRKIVHACGRLGIRRLLHMSALGADPLAASAYLRSKGIGEQLVREADYPHSEDERWYLDGPKFIEGQALVTTVFRPSVIFGRGDSFLTMLHRLVHRLPLVPLAGAFARFQSIWVEDVARAFVASLENAATYGQRYDLCGPQVYTLRELVEYVATLDGRRVKVIPLSERLSLFSAWVFEHLPGPPLLTRDNVLSMQVPSVCQGDFPAVFGFEPTPLSAVAPLYLGCQASRPRYDALRASARRAP